jgi:Ni/Fe-hydrogenase subunit HybB-like protein
MDTYHVVLYIHLLALFVGVGAGAVIVACLFQLRAAQTLEAAAPLGRLAG